MTSNDRAFEILVRGGQDGLSNEAISEMLKQQDLQYQPVVYDADEVLRNYRAEEDIDKERK
jgi:hypothetical protein